MERAVPVKAGKWTGRGLSGAALKRLAVISMLADHFAVVFLENGLLYQMDHAWAALHVDPAVYGLLLRVILGLRILGRIAFPVYCFLLVQGFLHTRHYGAYLRTLILFALISEIPFDVAVMGTLFEPEVQNIYWTLAIGLAGLQFMRRAERFAGEARWFAWGAVMLTAGAVGHFLRVDYGWAGTVLILVLYLMRDSRALLFLTVLLFGLMTMPPEVLIGVAAAGLLICLYNGRRGTIRHKLFYYWFYPVHLAALWALGGLLLQ